MKKQTLKAANLKAAKDIAIVLSARKAISYTEFKELWLKSRRWEHPFKYWHMKRGEECESAGKYYGLGQNYLTTIQFLIDHGLATKVRVNGLLLFVATPLCYKGKLKMFDNE